MGNDAAIDWFYGIDIHSRINIRELFVDICGVEWGEISFILSHREKIEILFNKLKSLGLIN